MRFEANMDSEAIKKAQGLFDQACNLMLSAANCTGEWRALLTLVQKGEPGAVVFFGHEHPSDVLVYALAANELHENSSTRDRLLAAAKRILGIALNDPSAAYVIVANHANGTGTMMELGESDLEKMALQFERSAKECRKRAEVDRKARLVH